MDGSRLFPARLPRPMRRSFPVGHSASARIPASSSMSGSPAKRVNARPPGASARPDRCQPVRSGVRTEPRNETACGSRRRSLQGRQRRATDRSGACSGSTSRSARTLGGGAPARRGGCRAPGSHGPESRARSQGRASAGAVGVVHPELAPTNQHCPPHTTVHHRRPSQGLAGRPLGGNAADGVMQVPLAQSA